MIQLSSALLEPPAPAPTASEPPGSPPGAPFSTVLDDHQARTAIAEGHQSKRQDGDDDGERDDDARTHDDAQQPAAASASLAALLGGVPLPASVATAVVARLPLGVATSPTAAGSAPAPGLPGATTPMPTGPSVPAAASALPLGAGVAAGTGAGTTASAAGSQASSGLPAAAAPSEGTPAPLPAAVADQLQAVAAAPAKPGVPTSGGAASVATAAATAATAPAAAGGARAGGAGSGSADQAPSQGAQQPAAATAPSAAPIAPPAAATQASAQLATADAAPGVGLEHAVETVRLALRAAADRGVTHARISLTPRELGGIEVHLRQTADGLVARVVAEHATAAQLLQHAGGDLRRSLEAQGLNLLRLDIGASGEQGGRTGDRRTLADAGADGTSNGAHGTDADDPLAALDGAADPTSTTTTLALSNGALVDVLA
jgi:flagellar hook-length control protein FliK